MAGGGGAPAPLPSLILRKCTLHVGATLLCTPLSAVSAMETSLLGFQGALCERQPVECYPETGREEELCSLQHFWSKSSNRKF